MKLTPLDIHHKEFSHSLRGYNETEVDEFLDQVADELERLFKENIDLNEKIEVAEEKVRGYQDMERTLHNTLVSAQKSAEDIIAKAEHEAAVVLKDAEVKAKEVIHGALQQKQKATNDLMRIKQSEEEFRLRFKDLLDKHLRSVGEIELPEDVRLLTGQAGGETVAEVEITETAFAPKPVASAPVAPAESAAERRSYAEALAPEPAPAPRPEPAPARDDTQPIEPPESGFVTGIQLGEVVEPDLGPEEPVFEDPTEFKLDFGSLGERDDDLDIEEID
ncbi:MAG: DivIVA domain-containing protein [Coriobacteriia bacterium]|nr:DivIVA domain-containing protein [Coriobacteriia bacterium]MBN2822580.1 DivIVA domain-containing protein [Coriobacteriia bacterium]